MKSKNASLTLTEISHSWWAKDLFENVDATIVGGQVIWLIWPNWAGKSTLMNIMAWEIDPRSGIIETVWELALVTQWLDADLSMTVHEYIISNREHATSLEEREIMIAIGKVGGKEIDIHQALETLSWGQKTKVRIAKCLLDDVNILLLDEPTNHLDHQWIKALQWVIKRFHGPVVIVSHDRQFLDDVSTDIFDLRWGNLEIYGWTYTAYMHERKVRAQKQMEAWKDQEEKRKKAEKWLAELKERASFYDSPRWGKLIRSRKKLFERNFVDEKIERVQEEKQMWMAVSWGKHKDKEMLLLTPGEVGRQIDTGDAIFMSSLSKGAQELYMILEELKIFGKDRIVIVGENGSGKTTLLDVLKQNLPSENTPKWTHDLIHRWASIRLGWFSQHDESLRVDERVMWWCLRMFPAWRDQAMIRSKLAGANIPEEDLVKRMSELSYGQRVKIRFLQLMLSSYDLLILDEPTNHLDISTREALEMMLQQYEGALLVVSHDRRFIQQIGILSQRSIEDNELKLLPRIGEKWPHENYVSSWEKEKIKEEQEKESEDADPYDFMGR